MWLSRQSGDVLSFNTMPPSPRAAAEFCKISGLLCSYGLYRVVCHEQLALYCRGCVASFSVRVVALDQQGKSESNVELADPQTAGSNVCKKSPCGW